MAIRAIKTMSLGALLAITIVAAGVWAHGGGAGSNGPGYETMHGPGMMGGYETMHGPGMMGGYETMHGPGMMGGYETMHGPGMMGGYGTMHGPGMMGGYGTMHGPGMMGMGPVWMLNLTDDQRDIIGKLREELRKKQWTTMGQIMDERQKLSELYSADSPDANKVGAIYGKIFDLRRQMIEATIDVRNRMQALLTQEQQTQLDQWRHGWGAGFGGPGMMDH